MVDPSVSGSPLAELAAGGRATHAFELLGNETRLAILVALWESHEPFGEDTAVRFSELYARVGTTDSSQFNYHLDRLTDHFVDSTTGGYELSEAGLTFIRAVIAGAGIEEPTLEPTEIDTACTLCGGSVMIMYESGWVYILCAECDGLWMETEVDRYGVLGKFSLSPAGVANRAPNEVYAAAWVSTYQRVHSMIEGVCPTCSGQVDRSFGICDDHESEGRCPNCERNNRIIARFRCSVCKMGIRSTVGSVAKYHPAVVGFYYDHGLKLQHGFNDLAHITRRLNLGSTDVEQSSDDPPRVRVTVEINDNEIWVVLNENLSVVDIGE